MSAGASSPSPSTDAERSGFWTENQPGFKFTDAVPGTPEFYAEVEAHRYGLEPAIPEMARFGEWRDRDVLEAGCGIATDGINFARRGARYTGVDFSDSAVALARNRFELEGVEGRIEQASIAALPAADASLDLVYSNGVIHHLPETGDVVAEMHRVLRPGGTAIVMVYHRSSLNYWVNILVIRRLLALGLLVPGAAGALGRLTAERPDVLDGHRRLLDEHGLGYLRDRELFLSNNTDGPDNPLSKVYTRADARELFSAFSSVRTAVRFMNLRLYPAGDRLAATRLSRSLERRIGWHLWIEAVK